MSDILFSPRILGEEHHGRPVGVHHLLLLGIDDGRVEAGLQGHGKIDGRDDRPAGEAEGDITDSQHGGQAKLGFDRPHCPQGFQRLLLFGRHGQGQAVDQQIFLRNACGHSGITDSCCGCDPSGCGCGNPFPIEGQPDEGRAVLAGQRKDGAEALLLSGDGIDQHLAVGGLEGPLQGGRVGGVQDQRCGGDPGGGEHGPLQGRRLVDAGKSAVEVDQGGAGIYLLLGFAPDVGGLPLAQFLAISLLAGGINALADKGAGGLAAYGDRRGAAGEKHPARRRGPGEIPAFEGAADRPDVGRGSAAAAADDPHPQGQHSLMIGGHLFGGPRKNRLAVPQDRQACIGLGDEGQRGDGAHFFENSVDPLHPQPAIGTEYVDLEGVESDRRGFGGGSQNGPPAVVEGHQGHDRQGGEFPAGDDRGPKLPDIEEGLQGDKVGSGFGESAHLLAEDIDHLVEGSVSHRFQETARGADRSRHETPRPGRPAGDLDRPGVDLRHPALQPVMGQLDPAASEGVGHQDIGAGLGVFPMNAFHHFRRVDVHPFGGGAGSQAPLLEHGSHGAVQNQHPLPYRPSKIGHLSSLFPAERSADALHRRLPPLKFLFEPRPAGG